MNIQHISNLSAACKHSSTHQRLQPFRDAIRVLLWRQDVFNECHQIELLIFYSVHAYIIRELANKKHAYFPPLP